MTLRAETGDTGDKLYQAGRYPEAAAAYQREIQEHADSPRLEYNLGTALMQAGQLEDAVAALERAATAATSDELRYNALYNLGLCYLRQARDAKSSEATSAYASSADAYKRALQLRPNEVAAKWNYELASQEKSKSSGGSANQPQQKQQQQDKQQQPGSLDKRQAEQLLSSAQREERDVQAKKQHENQPERPPAGKDW
jgi:Ca-activated chloride channel family protein